ncbi:hypothetical protein ACTXT7_012898 [Hymenolepis weldensis]
MDQVVEEMEIRICGFTKKYENGVSFIAFLFLFHFSLLSLPHSPFDFHSLPTLNPRPIQTYVGVRLISPTLHAAGRNERKRSLSVLPISRVRYSDNMCTSMNVYRLTTTAITTAA